MNRILRHILLGCVVATPVLVPTLRAHCDSLEGPVVTAAREALASGDVTPTLKWVQPDQDRAIRDAFDRTKAVRSQSKEAEALADMFFFETLVRLHRQGEGAPYTGLKHDEPVAPGIARAEHALATGNADPLVAETVGDLEKAIRRHFNQALELSRHANHSVEAGRKYVEAYVSYIHFVERLHEVAKVSAHAPANEAHGH